MSKFLRILIILFAPLAALPAAAQEDGPRAPVAALQDALLASMKAGTDGATLQERYKMLRDPMQQAFHFDVMMRGAVGGAWRDATPEQRTALAEAFGDMSTAIHADRFDSFSGQSFGIADTKDGPRGSVLVGTVIKRPGKDDVQLVYVVRESDGAWGIVDVLAGGGVSELATRRSEYQAVIQRQGVEGLAQALRGKADSLIGGS